MTLLSAKVPFQSVALDLLGLLPKSEDGNCVILHVTCHFSKANAGYASEKNQNIRCDRSILHRMDIQLQVSEIGAHR